MPPALWYIIYVSSVWYVEWTLRPLFFLTIFKNPPRAKGAKGATVLKKITDLVSELAAPAVAAAGCVLWDVEYVREAGAWYLRLYLDKPGGSVDILDCEAVSRAVEPLLDAADPIEGSYTFEVSSAGAERALKRPSDFAQFLGSPVTVKLYRARDGRKEFAGTLKAYDEAGGDVTVTVGKEDMVFSKADTALVRLRVEF